MAYEDLIEALSGGGEKVVVMPMSEVKEPDFADPFLRVDAWAPEQTSHIYSSLWARKAKKRFFGLPLSSLKLPVLSLYFNVNVFNMLINTLISMFITIEFCDPQCTFGCATSHAPPSSNALKVSMKVVK